MTTATGEIYTNALSRGLSIVPIPPREKGCKLSLWPDKAVNSARIMEGLDGWNYGVVADWDFCILDVDNLAELSLAISDLIPATYTVQTSRGKHFYFRHSSASRRLGNKAAGVFDFQADRKYVVGEGSTHPSGHVYACIDHSPIAVIPDALVDQLALYVAVRKARRSVQGLKSGDRHDMMRYAGQSYVAGMTREELLARLQTRNEEESEVLLSYGDLWRMADFIVKSREARPAVITTGIPKVERTK